MPRLDGSIKKRVDGEEEEGRPAIDCISPSLSSGRARGQTYTQRRKNIDCCCSCWSNNRQDAQENIRRPAKGLPAKIATVVFSRPRGKLSRLTCCCLVSTKKQNYIKSPAASSDFSYQSILLVGGAALEKRRRWKKTAAAEFGAAGLLRAGEKKGTLDSTGKDYEAK